MSNEGIPNGTKIGNAFFERGSWYHRTKTLKEDETVKYGKLGGFASPEEAEESFKKHEEEFKNQQRQLQAQSNRQEMMFKDYLIYWFENIYSERIETTTKMIGAYAVYDLIVPNIEYDVKLKQVTTSYLDEIISKSANMTESGGETSRLIIYIAMKDCVANGYLKVNPAKDTKPYPRPKPKIRILSKTQVSKLLSVARYTNWYLEILLGLFCGLRKGEILALKHDDFNLNERCVSISRQLVNDYEFENGTNKIIKQTRVERDPKTENSFRKIKVPNIIMEELEKREKLIAEQKEQHQDKYIDHNYISCTEFGESHSLTSLNNCLDKICNKCSLPHITVHGLRHMFATILIEQGATLTQISGLLGHSSVHTTFEYYCEIMDEREQILNYINSIFSVEEELTS